MDFIKTSSLRALIELTFQRNWNGLIWMSRKGVITKRVKTVQTALSRISAQPRSPAGRGTNVPRSAKSSVRLKSRPKSKPPADHATRPGKHCPRSAKPQPSRHAAHEAASRNRNSRTTADASVRAGKNVPRPAENHRPNLIRSTTPPTESSGPTVPTRPRPDCPADRPDRPSQRRGRPEARFEAQFHIFKPGLTLSRLKRPSTIYIDF
ncbi:unnamed protein product [Microthlaspi erraticum]|uniref:Uncharacterized protein n=1 Tax=Microthlaspi erraticum TaxID=1685480 RepID=A0A6D2JND9_9BRAS|nr:unnamed protein product [Microthlaspi erraticum]